MTSRIPGTVIVDHAVVGVSDLAATQAFFTAFGFVEQTRRSLDGAVAQALYGLSKGLFLDTHQFNFKLQHRLRRNHPAYAFVTIGCGGGTG